MQLLDEEIGGRQISAALQDTFNDTFTCWLPVLLPAHCNSSWLTRGAGCDALRNGPAFGSVLLRPFSPSEALSCGRDGTEEVFPGSGPSGQRSMLPSHLGEGFHAAVDVLVAVHG